MKIPERLVHIFEVIKERVTEGPFMHHSAGRLRFMDDLDAKIRGGGTISLQDMKRLNLMPSNWRRRARITRISAVLSRENNHKILVKNT